jgi:hypothetical protein
VLILHSIYIFYFLIILESKCSTYIFSVSFYFLLS